MTREEAKQMFRDDKNSQGCYKAVLTKIDKIYDAFEEQMRQGQLLPIDSVSKRFEIDFDGNVLAGIEITNNEPKVFGAMNGWGNGISLDKCKITEKTY